MHVVTKDEYLQKRESLLQDIARGAIFVYPSDTIYRMGCDATNERAVRNLRELKASKMPFSIIAPSKQWIRNNCVVDEQAEDALDLLPGKYVLVLSLKNPNAIAPSVVNSGLIGVRIPRHWTHEIVSLLGRPVVSTSANVSGDQFMTRKTDLHPSIKRVAKFCLYEGTIEGAKVQVLDPKKSLT